MLCVFYCLGVYVSHLVSFLCCVFFIVWGSMFLILLVFWVVFLGGSMFLILLVFCVVCFLLFGVYVSHLVSYLCCVFFIVWGLCFSSC